MENLKLNTKKLSDQIVEILEKSIIEGEYQVGEKLPSERILSAKFGVSRPSVRDALKILSAHGLIETRHGGGHFVSDSLQQNLIPPWQGLLERYDYLHQDVLDFRRSLEGEMAQFAAERATETDLIRLKSCLDEIDDAMKGDDLEKQALADVHFHQAIAESAHNVLFTHLSANLLSVLHENTKDNIASLFRVTTPTSPLGEQHHAIYEAILNKDPVQAKKAVMTHLNYVADTLGCLKIQSDREKRAAKLAHKSQQKKSMAKA